MLPLANAYGIFVVSRGLMRKKSHVTGGNNTLLQHLGFGVFYMSASCIILFIYG